jgi:putative heme-binding domain-containing protein
MAPLTIEPAALQSRLKFRSSTDMRNLALLVLLSFRCAAQNQPSPDVGEKLFMAHCAVCHGPKGDGGKGTNLAQPRLPRVPDDEALARIITFGIPGTEMPLTRMTPQQLASVIAYVRSFGRIPSEMLTGDPQRGAALYRDKGNCTQCHAIHGRGGTLGPELSGIGARRSAGYFRESLTDPEAAIPDSFSSYKKVTLIPDNFLQVRVVTAEGRQLAGARVNEDTFSIQIRDASGRIQSFLKEELRELHKDWGKSPMPSYRDVFSRTELEDVVAYLVSLRGPQ